MQLHSKIPGVDHLKEAETVTQSQRRKSTSSDGVCNKSVAPQTCAQKYPNEDRANSLKCCEDLPEGGTKDHMSMYKAVSAVSRFGRGR
ncbi:MAG: hypothetical protein U0T83_07335 [Bacteriovoracaceae bacterium]